MECINLKERFGDRFKVDYEESYYAQYGPNARIEDPWYMILLCRHAYDTSSDKVDAGQDGTEQSRDASPTSTSWTAGIDCLPGGSGDLTGHLGPYNSGDDTDDRPPYRVVAFIERFK